MFDGSVIFRHFPLQNFLRRVFRPHFSRHPCKMSVERRASNSPLLSTHSRKHLLLPVFCYDSIYQQCGENASGKGPKQFLFRNKLEATRQLLCTSCQLRAYHPKKRCPGHPKEKRYTVEEKEYNSMEIFMI